MENFSRTNSTNKKFEQQTFIPFANKIQFNFLFRHTARYDQSAPLNYHFNITVHSSRLIMYSSYVQKKPFETIFKTFCAQKKSLIRKKNLHIFQLHLVCCCFTMNFNLNKTCLGRFQDCGRGKGKNM